MDWPTLTITGLATVAAIVSAVVAVKRARAASRSEKAADVARDEARTARDESAQLAAKATAAFERQAAALERNNELKEEELRPPSWTGPRHVSGDLYSMTNTTGRTVIIDSFELEPEDAERWFRVYAEDDRRFEPGSSFDFMASEKAPVRARRFILVWRFEDENEDTAQRFIVAL